MSASIWLGRNQNGRHFYDSYLNAPLLPALGLSYWNWLNPMLNERSELPLERNEEVAAAIRAAVAERLDGPDALMHATAYLSACGMSGDPARHIPVWRRKADELLAMLDQSTRTRTPLTMWL